MREIKFRAWHDNQMWEVRAIDWDYKGKIISCHLENDKNSIKVYLDKKFGDEVELMQYTELKDKNGKEIYEGDILFFEPFGKHNNDRIVKFKQGMFLGELVRNGYNDAITSSDFYKVIGNIHENPELLEV